MGWMSDRKEKRLIGEIDAAERNVEKWKNSQKDAQSLRGMPGSRTAVKTAADNIRRANKGVKSAEKNLDKFYKQQAKKEAKKAERGR